MKMIPITNQANATPFKQPLLRGMAIGLFALSLNGCSFLEPYKPTLTQGTVISQESISLLQEGLTKDQARQLFGPPLGADPFNPNHWDYAFYTTDDEFHPDAVKRLSLHFDEDEMIESWEISDKPIQLQRH